MRTIKVAAPATSVSRAITDFNGNTWGQLKEHVIMQELLGSGNVEAIVRGEGVTNLALTRNDAQLPEGDFKLYLIPTKNKAGTVSPQQASEIAQQISAAIVEASAQSDTDELRALKNDLITAIENFYNVELDKEEEPADADPGTEDVLAEARALMNDTSTTARPSSSSWDDDDDDDNF